MRAAAHAATPNAYRPAMVLVTGGAGFIGSHIVDALREGGHDVRVLDLADGDDVRDPDVVERALDGVDAVCHQAAMVGLGVDLEDITDYVGHNDVGTAVLLRAISRGTAVRRVVLASSMVVYGEGRYRCAEHGVVAPGPRAVEDLDAGRYEPPCPRCGRPLAPEAVGEDAPVDPRNVYAATKLHQEHLAWSFARETGIPVTALRYHNVYGPRMPRDTPYAGVAAIFASALAAGRAPQVLEDGGQLRDFVHVRDVARANVLALTTERPYGGALNVCSGRRRSIADMAWALHAAAGDGAPAPEIVGGYRLGDVRHVFADPARATEVLEFTAREDFVAGMGEMAGAMT